MRLLNDRDILEYRKIGLLKIEPMHRKSLLPTRYIFRLGGPIKVWDEKQSKYLSYDLAKGRKRWVKIPAHGYALISSLERFYCSEKVLCIFGQHSMVLRRGLQLNHSPFIDPTFEGNLEMGLENLLSRPLMAKYGQPIGKACFFDISGSQPISSIKGTMSDEDYKRRKNLKQPSPSDEEWLSEAYASARQL